MKFYSSKIAHCARHQLRVIDRSLVFISYRIANSLRGGGGVGKGSYRARALGAIRSSPTGRSDRFSKIIASVPFAFVSIACSAVPREGSPPITVPGRPLKPIARDSRAHSGRARVPNLIISAKTLP